MHVRELAELAALIAVHWPSLLRGCSTDSRSSWERAHLRLPPGLNEQYWSAFKCRLDRWSRLLRPLAATTDAALLPPTLAWPRAQPVLEEILVSELLTRIWAAAAAAYDALAGEDELEGVARNVFAGHLDARRQVLSLLADGRVIPAEEVSRLNHLRRRVERWTDMLLAHLSPLTDIGVFAFQADRAHDFADDLDRDACAEQRRFTCQLIVSSLRASFTVGLAESSPNRDLNVRLAATLLPLFRDDQEDSLTIAGPLWLERMHEMALQTEGMVEELMRLDHPDFYSRMPASPGK
jgi:hypothetical protein